MNELRLRARSGRGLTVAFAVICGASGSAHADPEGGTVTGSVALAPDAKRAEIPVMSEGFVPRARNPLKAPRPLDPRPGLVAVLVGGTPAAEDKEPPGAPVRFKIIGESFEAPVLPVVAGSVVEFRNEGQNSPRLFSPDKKGLVPGDPISPKGRRDTKKVEPAGKAFEIRDRESAHLSTHVVALPHRYFAPVSDKGEFQIEGVAPGEWKLRFWYRDGWVEMPTVDVSVTAKRTTKLKPVDIPPRINTQPPK